MFSDVPDVNAFALEEVFVIGCFVRVLKPSPAADVVHQDHLEVGGAIFDIPEQFLEGQTAADPQAAFAIVGVGVNYFNAVNTGVLADFVRLVFGGVLLVLRGHSDVFGSANAFGRFRLFFCDLIVLHSTRSFNVFNGCSRACVSLRRKP